MSVTFCILCVFGNFVLQFFLRLASLHGQKNWFIVYTLICTYWFVVYTLTDTLFAILHSNMFTLILFDCVLLCNSITIVSQ